MGLGQQARPTVATLRNQQNACTVGRGPMAHKLFEKTAERMVWRTKRALPHGIPREHEGQNSFPCYYWGRCSNGCERRGTTRVVSRRPNWAHPDAIPPQRRTPCDPRDGTWGLLRCLQEQQYHQIYHPTDQGVPVILGSPSITPPTRMRLLTGVRGVRVTLKKTSVTSPPQLLLSNTWSDPVHFRRGVHIASTIALLRKKTRKVQTTHQTVPSQRLTSIQERALCRSDQYPHCLSTK